MQVEAEYPLEKWECGVRHGWCLPSDRIRRGGPLVVSFLFNPESICSRTPYLHDGQATVVWCRREEVRRAVRRRGRVVVMGGTRKRFRVERWS